MGLVSSNQRGAARRMALVEATRRALLARGSAGVRVRDVATEADISPSAILYHYPRFEDLVIAALAHGLDAFHLRRTRAMEAHSAAPARLVGVLDACLASGRDDEEVRLIASATALADHSVPLRALLGSTLDRAMFTYQAIIETGVAQGSFTLAEPAASIARNLSALELSYGQAIVLEISGYDHAAALGLTLGYASAATGAPLAAPEPDVANAPDASDGGRRASR